MKYIIFLIATLVLAVSGPVEAMAQSFSGNATYYGNRWHGRRTSSGEIYHKDSLTCAHRTLPFGTLLRVTNPKNGKDVVVKVTDRGPFRKNAVIDLSMAAAKEIDMVRDGIAMIEAVPVNVGESIFFIPGESGNGLPELKFWDIRSGNSYTASEYAAASREERAAQLRTMAIVGKEKPAGYLVPQHYTADASKGKARSAKSAGLTKSTK